MTTRTLVALSLLACARAFEATGAVDRRTALVIGGSLAARPACAATAPSRPISNAIAGELPLTVGLGTCLVSDGNVVTQVGRAIDAGYRLFDTAQRYGNEAGVGRGLRAAAEEGKIKRSEIFVTTKVWCDNMGEGLTATSVRESMRRLGLDYIDLVLIHWPGRFLRPSPENTALNRRLRLETWRELEALHKTGEVRNIGVSNYGERPLKELLTYAKVRPSVNQFEIHPFNTRNELVGLCQREGILVNAYSPLGGKGNAGAVTDELLADPVIVAIGKEHQKTPAQVILRWHLQRSITPIPKASSKGRIAENIDVLSGFELSTTEMAAITALEKGAFAVFDSAQLA